MDETASQKPEDKDTDSPGEPEQVRVIRVVQGDLLVQDVEVIVNPWNRNILPYWVLTPQGVAGALLKKAGKEPFRELSEAGVLPEGGAVLTGAGRLYRLKGIIHVATLNLFWRASEQTIALSARNAMEIVNRLGFRSVAFPLLGAGVGGVDPERAYRALRDALVDVSTEAEVRIVRFRRGEL